jgi:hypothetical protein
VGFAFLACQTRLKSVVDLSDSSSHILATPPRQKFVSFRAPKIRTHGRTKRSTFAFTFALGASRIETPRRLACQRKKLTRRQLNKHSDWRTTTHADYFLYPANSRTQGPLRPHVRTLRSQARTASLQEYTKGFSAPPTADSARYPQKLSCDGTAVRQRLSRASFCFSSVFNILLCSTVQAQHM